MKQHQLHREEKQRLFAKKLGTYLMFLIMLLYIWLTFWTLAKFVLAATTVIWLTSLYAYWKLPTMREAILKNNRWYTFGYCAGLIVFQMTIRFFWGLSPAELTTGMDASVIHAAPATNVSIVQMLNTAFLLATVSVPGSYLLMTFKNLRHAAVQHEDVYMKRYRKM